MEKIKILIVRPDKEPEEVEIENELTVLQEIVGGYIEVVKPPSHGKDDVIIICNEEGKFTEGCLPNRPILDKHMRVFDILYGTFIVCRFPAGAEAITSLTDEQAAEYAERYSLEQAAIDIVADILFCCEEGGEADEHSV